MTNLRVIEFPTAEEHEALAQLLRELAEDIAAHPRPVTGIGVVICFADGALATEHAGTDLVRLLGALRLLGLRIEAEVAL